MAERGPWRYALFASAADLPTFAPESDARWR